MARQYSLPSRREFGKLIAAIAASPHGISKRLLSEALDVDPATVKRRIKCLRDDWGAPISSSIGGYFWRPSPTQRRRAEAIVAVFCEAE